MGWFIAMVGKKHLKKYKSLKDLATLTRKSDITSNSDDIGIIKDFSDHVDRKHRRGGLCADDIQEDLRKLEDKVFSDMLREWNLL